MIRYIDRKKRILMVDKDPCIQSYSVYLRYATGVIRRTRIPELRNLPTRQHAERALKAFADGHGCKKEIIAAG